MKRKSADKRSFGPMGQRHGVRLSFAGVAYLDRYADLIRGLSLTPGRVLVLSFVHDHPGRDQMSLARALGIKKAAAMTVVNRMVELGFLIRVAGPNKRTNALHLTPRGVMAFATALRQEEALNRRMFEDIDRDELDRVFAILDQIESRARAMCDDPEFDRIVAVTIENFDSHAS